MDLFDFYAWAKAKIILEGYEQEIHIVESREFKDMTPGKLFVEYVFVVVSSGMKNQVAQRIFNRFLKDGPGAIGHKGKRMAIEKAYEHFLEWHKELSALNDINDILVFLKSLPWIGDITKYHLARNLGIDVAKPDRHMVRLAYAFNYPNVQKMCEAVSLKTGDRVGVVDVVMWRYCNLHNNYLEEINV